MKKKWNKHQTLTMSALKRFCNTKVALLFCLSFVLFCTNVYAQQTKTITGNVSDKDQQPLPGVSVVLKGTVQGTVTDMDGNFVLKDVAETSTVVFSFVGMIPQEIAVGSKNTFQVTLKEDAIGLEEVVAIGYGTKKKVNLTGAVASVSGSELEKLPTSNITNSIAGRISGVFARKSNGRPGSGSSLNIRGLNTLGNNSPLIVVDNIPRSDFSAIDPNEIESITVLKDAAATAVYGARANNGVFLITTKRGAIGKPTITYTGSYGLQNPTNYPDLMNAYQYATTRNQGYINRGYDPTNPSHAGFFISEEDIEAYRKGEKGTDWYDETFSKNAALENHNITLNGGSKAIKYFLSVGYVNQDGMYETIGYKSYRFRSNIDAKITNSTSLKVNIDGQQENFENPGWDANTIFAHLIRQSPTNMAFWPSGRPYNTAGEHPVEMVNNSGYNRTLQNTFQGTLDLTQKLDFVTKGLTAKARASYGKTYKFNKYFFLPYTMYNEDAEGNVTGTKVVGGQTSLSEEFRHSYSSFYNVSIDYDRTFGDHDINGLLLYEQSEDQGDMFKGSKRDFSIDSKDELFVSGPENENFTGNSLINDARKALVGRLAYAYQGKYLFEGSFRYDGSYIFPKGERFGFFPAFSAAWRISEEKFLKDNADLDFIDNIKLRASRGLIGNDRVAPFQFQDAFSLYTDIGPFFNGSPSPAIFAGVYPNPNITWEESINTNAGIDISVYNGKLSLELEYFHKKTKDILWSRIRSTPSTFGRSLPNENYAEVENKGWEMVLSHRNEIGKDLKYTVRLTGSYATNKVTRIDDPADALDYQKQLGKSIGYRAGYKSLGFFQSQDEADNYMGGKQFGMASLAGDIKYADIDGNEVIDSKDQIVLSNNTSTPKIIFGLAGSVTWKAFDLDFLIQGAAKVNALIVSTGRNMFQGGGSSNTFSYLTDSWSETNKDAKYPLAWVDSRSVNNRTSSVWLKDSPFARLKSVNFGYTLPNKVLEKTPLESVRVFVSGENLFTWSSFKEFDPEVESGAGSYYPQQKTVSMGVRISF
ncbi:TonB-dependent receptor [Puteibacter caeruleilacunae]|nr:TonB-dependent receptor [Puteibacter caeruleilacunae]